MITYTLVRKDRRDGLVSIQLHLFRDRVPALVTTITTEPPGAAMKRFAEARVHLRRLGVRDNNDASWGYAG